MALRAIVETISNAWSCWLLLRRVFTFPIMAMRDGLRLRDSFLRLFVRESNPEAGCPRP
jgi:hypothetical protein